MSRTLLLRASLVAGIVLGLVVLGGGWAARGAEARLVLRCLSAKFQPATTNIFGEDYTLSLTTGPASETPNGEMAPLFGSSLEFSHATRYVYQDPSFFEPIVGILYVEIPNINTSDLNGNGIHDLFEFGEPLTRSSTSGVYDDGFNQGPATLTWERAAGAKFGICTIHFAFLPEVTFAHNFEVLQYEGTYQYQRTGSNITGTASLTNLTDASLTVGGSMPLQRVSRSVIALPEGGLTNAANQPLLYEERPSILRQGSNYFDIFAFADFDATTSYSDYAVWYAVWSDPNDADGDRVPDLSDDITVTPLTRPALRLSSLADGFVNLVVTGQAGKRYEIQAQTGLGGTNWLPVSAFTTTSATQSVAVPRSASGTMFYRVLAQ